MAVQDDWDMAFASDNEEPQGASVTDENSDVPDLPADTEATAPGEETTAEIDGEAKPPVEENKGVLPKELEPYKSLLDAKKWDVSKPEGLANAIKSYQELEQFASRTKNEIGLTQAKADRFRLAIESDINAVNQMRKQAGMPEFKTETRSMEEREKALDEQYTHINNVLSGKDSGESLQWLNQHFEKNRLDMKLEKALAERNVNKSQDQLFQERKSTASSNYGNLVAKDPNVTKHIDALTPFFDKGGVFDSFGIDVLDMASTPERLQAFTELGKALETQQNLEKIVEERVNAELERRRTIKNGKSSGEGKGAGQGKSDFDSDELAFVGSF